MKRNVEKSSAVENSMRPLRYMPYFSCNSEDRPAARVVPYDSPAMNFGDAQRA